MASDSTYLFFRREFDSDVGKVPLAPVITTSRVIHSGRVRGSSVPPIHFGKGSRAGSVPPARVLSVGQQTTSRQPVGIGSRLSIATVGSSAVSVAPLSGYQPRPIARRASIAAPGGSIVKIWTVGSAAPQSAAGGLSSLSRGFSEVTRSSIAAPRSVYRPSILPAYGRSAASLAPPSATRSRLSSASVKLPATAFVRSSGTAVKPPSQAVYRSASIPTFIWNENLAFPSPFPSVRNSFAPKGLRASVVGLASAKEAPKFERRNLKILPNEVKTEVKVTTDNDVQRKKPIDFEGQLNKLIPIHEESLSKLRARTQLAKDQLGQHKVLLDRYLPLHLGPENDVQYEVENRYEQLLSRMPQLEQRLRSRRNDNDYATIIAPYKPASTPPKGQKIVHEVANIPVKTSFTPKISDTRKRARNVLCKVKGDPRYFDFS